MKLNYYKIKSIKAYIYKKYLEKIDVRIISFELT